MGPESERIWNFLDFQSRKPRENFQENLETLSVQLFLYFSKILPPNQEITRHRISQFDSKQELSRPGGDPRLQSPQPVPFPGASAVNMAAAHHDIHALHKFVEHLGENRGVVLQIRVD